MKKYKSDFPVINEDMTMSTEMPEYEDRLGDYREIISIFKNILEDQQAGLTLMKRYLQVIEYKLNKQ